MILTETFARRGDAERVAQDLNGGAEYTYKAQQQGEYWVIEATKKEE